MQKRRESPGNHPFHYSVLVEMWSQVSRQVLASSHWLRKQWLTAVALPWLGCDTAGQEESGSSFLVCLDLELPGGPQHRWPFKS